MKFHFRMTALFWKLRLLIFVLVALHICLQIHFELKNSQNEAIKRSFDQPTTFMHSLNLITDYKETFFMVIAIPSLPESVSQRNAIRSTWMNLTRWSAFGGRTTQADHVVKVMFILGQVELGDELRAEIKAHKDIYIVMSLEEKRTVLKYKVLWALKHSLRIFNYSYFVKTDQDILVNFPVLLEDLRSLPRKRLYTGSCNMSYGGFKGYPKWKYCSGGGYVLSRDIVEEMGFLPEEVDRVPFKPEDGYIGWLVYNLGKLRNFEIPIKSRHALQANGYKCGPFKHWFYHQIKTPEKMKSFFEVVNSNSSTPCSSLVYTADTR